MCRRAPPGISSENNILMYIRRLPPPSPPLPLRLSLSFSIHRFDSPSLSLPHSLYRINACLSFSLSLSVSHAAFPPPPPPLFVSLSFYAGSVFLFFCLPILLSPSILGSLLFLPLCLPRLRLFAPSLCARRVF